MHKNIKILPYFGYNYTDQQISLLQTYAVEILCWYFGFEGDDLHLAIAAAINNVSTAAVAKECHLRVCLVV